LSQKKTPELGLRQSVHAIALDDLAFELPGHHEGSRSPESSKGLYVRLIPVRFPEVPAFGSALDGELGQGVGSRI
jgi:hypothetical protein